MSKIKKFEELTEQEYKEKVYNNVSVLYTKIIRLGNDLEKTQNYSLYSLIILIVIILINFWFYLEYQDFIKEYQDLIKSNPMKF